ncbi:MAG: FKBP-type peptidyl-prolyl cis-trans isomerase [Flavobacteriales bacterium]|jgi:FKBP-type peptidyl-prolyl cis-trans isomerase FklB
MTRKSILLLLALLVSAVVAQAQDKSRDKKSGKKGKKSSSAPAEASKPLLSNKADSVAYALGVSMFTSTNQMGFSDINFDVFMKGMEGQRDGRPVLSGNSADSLIRAEMNRITQARDEASKKEGEAFLLANKSREGVQTTASGLQYKIIKEGNGRRPDANDKVTVHYHGTLIDGTVFDSSVQRGKTITFGLNQVIAGWTEGLQLMSEGSKYMLFIPQNLAYGSRGQGKIQPYSALVFEVELFTVEPVN